MQRMQTNKVTLKFTGNNVAGPHELLSFIQISVQYKVEHLKVK